MFHKKKMPIKYLLLKVAQNTNKKIGVFNYEI